MPTLGYATSLMRLIDRESQQKWTEELDCTNLAALIPYASV